MRTGTVITGIIAVVLVVASVVAFNHKKQNTNTLPSSSSDSSNTTARSSAATAAISYNGSLFSPSQVTIKKGDTIVIKNNSSNAVDFESDPHPIHTAEPELNIGGIEPGKSRSFVLSRVGSWGYHNHLNSSQTGTIIVR